MIAALYVMKDGHYAEVSGVELWDEAMDARHYRGPYPVIAHPPCERWGRYWSGGPSASYRRELGADGGCFEAALASVRRFGGILEHPEASHAWARFGIPRPNRRGGWINDLFGGWTCCVEQGHYGHLARKATWLYAVGPKPPEMIWGKFEGGIRLDEGFHSAEERRRSAGRDKIKRLTPRQNKLTPIAFRDYLIAYARSCATLAASARSLKNLAPPCAFTQASNSGGIRTEMEGAPS